jgi:mxaA protein
MQTDLPGYDIHFATGVAHVPSWDFHVSPLRVAQRSTADIGDLRGNLPAPAISMRPAVLGMSISGLIAAVAGFACAGLQGWLPGISRKRPPFARAAQRIARLKQPQTEAVLRELQHAFDLTDGRHVFAEDLDGFLSRHPAFAGLGADIRSLFALIHTCFFAPGATGCHDHPARIIALAKSLRRVERSW